MTEKLNVRSFNRKTGQASLAPIELAEQGEIVQITPIPPGQYQVVGWYHEDGTGDDAIELIDVVAWAIVRNYDCTSGAAEPVTTVQAMILNDEDLTLEIVEHNWQLGIVRAGDMERARELVKEEAARRERKR